MAKSKKVTDVQGTEVSQVEKQVTKVAETPKAEKQVVEKAKPKFSLHAAYLKGEGNTVAPVLADLLQAAGIGGVTLKGDGKGKIESKNDLALAVKNAKNRNRITYDGWRGDGNGTVKLHVVFNAFGEQKPSIPQAPKGVVCEYAGLSKQRAGYHTYRIAAVDVDSKAFAQWLTKLATANLKPEGDGKKAA